MCLKAGNCQVPQHYKGKMKEACERHDFISNQFSTPPLRAPAQLWLMVWVCFGFPPKRGLAPEGWTGSTTGSVDPLGGGPPGQQKSFLYTVPKLIQNSVNYRIQKDIPEPMAKVCLRRRVVTACRVLDVGE